MRARNAGHHPLAVAFEPLEPRQLLDASGELPEVFSHPKRNIESLVTADLDADGDQDIALVLDRRFRFQTVQSIVVVLANDGNGNFERAARRAMTVHAESLAAGDFNGDGRDELAIATEQPDGGSLLRILELDSDARLLRIRARGEFAEAIIQLEAVASGSDPDQLLAVLSVDTETEQVTEARIFARNGQGFTTIDTVFQIADSAVSGVRIVDADGDSRFEVLVAVRTPQQPMEPLQASVQVFRQDPSMPGVFDSGQTLLTYDTILLDAPLLADVDGDGHRDLVVNTRPVSNLREILLYRGDGNGGFAAPELLHQVQYQQSHSYALSLYGSGIGPTGTYEIWFREWESFQGMPVGSGTRFVRLVNDGDGNFITASGSAGLDWRLTAVHLAHLGGDSVIDFISISVGAPYSAARSAVRVFNFDGADRPPLMTFFDVHGGDAQGGPDIVTTGQSVSLSSLCIDPEELIGEPGGIARIRYFLDVNGNGIIDDSDHRIGVGDRGATVRTVRAGWPRGTFHVLAQARDLAGNFSGAICSTDLLQIV